MEFSRPEYLSGWAVPISRGSSQPRDQTQVSCIAGGFFTSWATREALRRVMEWLLNIGQNCFWALGSYSAGKVSTKIKVKSLSHLHLGSRLWKGSRAIGREGGKRDSERLQIVPGMRAQRPLEISTFQKDSGSIKKLVKYVYSNQQLDLTGPGGMWKWPDSIGRKRKIVKQLQNLLNREEMLKIQW